MKIASPTYIVHVIAVLCFAITQHAAFAQQKETEEDTTEKKNRNIFQFAIKAISRTPADSARQASVLNTKSETPFLPYNTKIVRHIIIKEYGFERNFSDTSQETHYFGTTLLNKLHRNTREWVIRDNLFIKENEPLNPYIVADNERYLRSLDFIQDVRSLKPLPNKPDSVDVFIITKDLFSITGQLYDLSPGRFKAKVGDVNIRGMGKNFFLQRSFIKHVIQISDTKFITTRIVLQTLLLMHRSAIQPFILILATLTKMKKHGTYNSTDHWFRLTHTLQAPYCLEQLIV